ncbi:hypothetical protein MODO_3156 [Myroides odoratimimus]|uniref:DUF3164 family protein n=1 Tax=Myroides odoratimimus TaxID=76832 RepID=UPI000723E908|nr:DUF3164 family protein [Myroides odoratimimus]GAQ15460.1 hypothetical protein MODO_3156 [Myroides odoratimimus]STZ48160.1 Uncharacterised protein [Myroides odoratimimus]
MENTAQTIDLGQLTSAQIKDLQQQIEAKRKEDTEREKRNKAALVDLTEDVVDKHIDNFVGLQGDLNRSILNLFDDAKAIIDARAEVYGNKKRDQESHTLTKRDGTASIKMGWNIKPTFDGTESEGIAKIKEYMSSLAGDEQNEKIMMEFLNTFLKTDAQGNYNPQLVRKLNEKREVANSKLFDDGMDIIEASIVDIRTSMFAKGYKLVEVEPGVEKRMEFYFSLR